MKRIIFSALLFVFFGMSLQAQVDNISEMSYEFVKKVAPSANGISTLLYGNTDAIEAVIETQFKNAANAKSKGLKSVNSFEGVVFDAISPKTLDYYYKLEEDKNNPDQTRITLFVSAGNYNFMSSDKFPEVMAAAKRWVASLDKATRVKVIDDKIDLQTKAVEDFTKDYDKLVEEGEKLDKDAESMQKEIEKLKEKIAENEQAQVKNEEAQAAEKAKLEVEQTKLKTLNQQKAKL